MKKMILLIGLVLMITAAFAEWNEVRKLLASDGVRGDQFGHAVSISGDYAIVGAIGISNYGDNAGSAYVYQYNGSTWNEQVKLLASDGIEGDGFGTAVSIAGDRAIVGAPNNEDNGSSSGSAYIYEYNGTYWIEKAKLTDLDGDPCDKFGISVAISGDLAIVGAYMDDDLGENAGAAFVYHREGNTWIEQQKLTPSDGEEFDWFGLSVGISGEYAIVGSKNNNEIGDYAGSAYIFHYNGSFWTEQQKLTASDGSEGDQFGTSVAIFNERAIIGASCDNTNDLYLSGSAYIFQFNGVMWLQQDKLTASDAGESDYFGTSVSISGDQAIVATPYDYSPVANAGSAYIFRFDGTSWSEQQKIIASDDDICDLFGCSVSISDNRVIVGAHEDDASGTNAGAAYIFENTAANGDDDLPSVTGAILYGAYPNPFNPTTTIVFSIPTDSRVTLDVFNIRGQKVRTLLDERMERGEHSIQWTGDDDNGKPCSSGVYLYRMKAGDRIDKKKMLLLK